MRKLELEGNLQLELNGERLALETQGRTAVMTVPSLRCGWRIFRALPRGMVPWTSSRVFAHWSQTGLALRVCVRHRTVMSAGDEKKPSRFLRALGLPPLAMHWTAVLRSLFVD